jgi:NAD(P)-dependent dehydrogenase (short-subunit alcohol dehydrogenase family)
MPEKRIVLVTGASSGVGQATAELLAQRGYRVFGTSRKPADAGDISAVTMLPLDVQSDDSVAACLTALSGLTDRLDILVNNAGYELAGAWKSSRWTKPRPSSRPISLASPEWSFSHPIHGCLFREQVRAGGV